MQRWRITPVIVVVLSLIVVSTVAASSNCAPGSCVTVAEARPAYGLSAAEILAYVEPQFDTPVFDHN